MCDETKLIYDVIKDKFDNGEETVFYLADCLLNDDMHLTENLDFKNDT